MAVILCSANMMHHTYSLAYVGPSLHPRDISYLAIVYDLL